MCEREEYGEEKVNINNLILKEFEENHGITTKQIENHKISICKIVTQILWNLHNSELRTQIKIVVSKTMETINNKWK